MLIVSFTIIFLCQKKSLAFRNKYPRVQCNRYAINYKNSHDEWKHDAIKEYIINQKLIEDEKDTAFEGTLQCFCKVQKVKFGAWKTQVYEMYDKDGETTFSEPVCWEIFKDLMISKVLGGSIAIIIVSVNIILKKIIVVLCEWVGEDT